MGNRRRRSVASAVVMVVLSLALGACGTRAKASDADAGRAGAPYASLDDAPEKLGEDGTTIMVGDPDAPVTVHLYEDPRCPVCEEFEQRGGGPVLRDALLRGKVKTEYTLASFLDDRMGGSGSKKAVNALRAALEAGKFTEYHEVLYDNQPEEAVDGFTDAFLLRLAGRVEGLRGPAFDAAVKDMKYRSFVTASEKAYDRAGGPKEPTGPGTPTAVINDVRVPAEYSGLLFDTEGFTSLLALIAQRPQEWGEDLFT